MLTSLDAAAVRRWCAAGLDALRVHQQEIDDLNVYPVPDGDTGTNLVLTVTSAYEAVLADEVANGAAGHRGGHSGDEPATDEVTRLGRVLRCMARGALLGARGNSGVILAQLLRGVADALAAAPEARGREMAAALGRAAEAGYTAVAEPVEGTVLTVARAAAEAAAEVTDGGHGPDGGPDLAVVCTAAAQGAADALARTPEQLAVLARAGVVDAGGRGLVVLLDALVAVVTGSAPATAPLARVARDPALLVVERETGSTEYAYEVQYLLDAEPEAVDRLKTALAELGDSLVVVGAGGEHPGKIGTFNVHVHVNDVGAAIEAGVEAGRPHRISVTRFADQVSGRAAGEPTGHAADYEVEGRAAVVAVRGDGLVRLFRSEGATVVTGIYSRGRYARPSTGEVLAAIRATGMGQVVVLPNDSDMQAVAAKAAEEARTDGRSVVVVPTSSPVQALAALAVADPAKSFTDDVIAMAEAAGATRWAEVTLASRDALTSAGPCKAGDVLALVEGEVILVGQDVRSAARELLDRMLGGGGELVTLVSGAEAPAGLADELVEYLTRAWPLVEATVYDGGQPYYPLLFGVE